MKLAFLGDSLTWGRYGGNFVAEVAARLPDHTIINEGEGGNTVVNLINRLDGVLEQRPDGIFVMVGGNDAISSSQPETRNYYRRTQKVPDGIVTPEMFTQAYREMLARIQQAQVQVWVGLAPLEYNPETVAAIQQYNRLAQKVAESLNMPILDLSVHFRADNVPSRPPLNQETIRLIGQRMDSGWSDYKAEQQRGGYSFTFDGLHLTPEAAKQVAEIVVEFLRPQLT
jgi:lysophospholipase L1-like esterase